MMRTTALFLAALWAVSATAAANEYFTFEEGERWIYREPSDLGIPGEEGFKAWREFEVLDREGELLTLSETYFFTPFKPDEVEILMGPWIRTLRVRGDEVDIVLPNGESHPYLRFEIGTYERRDVTIPPVSVVTAFVRVNAVVDPIETEVGTFCDCLDFDIRDTVADGGRVAEVWCRGVGLVLVNDEADGGFWPTTLARIDRREPLSLAFRRGDTSGDGTVDLSDGIAVLNHLFLGTEVLPCDDAADSDDSGSLEVTDAVALFGFLFLGARPPIAPGRDACGGDPTADALGCDRYVCP